jgi:Ribbon-helix-helix protein, copG family
MMSGKRPTIETFAGFIGMAKLTELRYHCCMTVQIALRISEELAASVDQLCAADGGKLSRSEFLRVAIEAHVG